MVGVQLSARSHWNQALTISVTPVKADRFLQGVANTDSSYILHPTTPISTKGCLLPGFTLKHPGISDWST